MDNPNGVAIGSDDKLYVVDSHDKTQRANDNYPREKKEGALYVKDVSDLKEEPGLSLQVGLTQVAVYECIGNAEDKDVYWN